MLTQEIEDDVSSLPLELARPPVPPMLAQGNLLPRTSVFVSDIVEEAQFVSIYNVQQIDARTVHQNAVLVQQDRSAEVVEIAELKRRAILAKQNQQFVGEAKHF